MIDSIGIASERSKQAFPEVDAQSVRCRFRDCTHTKENTCAVLEALAAGTLSRERYDRFLKLEIRYLRETEMRTAWQDRKQSSRETRRAFSK